MRTTPCSGNYTIRRNVILKKAQLRKIVFLLALSAMPRVYASELSMTPFGVANPVRLEISFTVSTGVTHMGFSSAYDQSCGTDIAVPGYTVGPAFALGATSPRVAYFNGHLPFLANDLCISTSGTIALDGIRTNLGACPAYAGCYSYTCDQIGGIITSITPMVPFTATCL